MGCATCEASTASERVRTCHIYVVGSLKESCVGSPTHHFVGLEGFEILGMWCKTTGLQRTRSENPGHLAWGTLWNSIPSRYRPNPYRCGSCCLTTWTYVGIDLTMPLQPSRKTPFASMQMAASSSTSRRVSQQHQAKMA